jgi:hypothetical protein
VPEALELGWEGPARGTWLVISTSSGSDSSSEDSVLRSQSRDSYENMITTAHRFEPFCDCVLGEGVACRSSTS